MKNTIEQKISEIRTMNNWRTVTALSENEILRLTAQELRMTLDELKEYRNK